MADLIAQGEQPEQRWRRALPEREPVLLGRSAGDWSVPWDAHVSRQHVQLLWTGARLEVSQSPQGRNPVFFRGQEAAEFSLNPGEFFVIGQTTFTLSDQRQCYRRCAATLPTAIL